MSEFLSRPLEEKIPGVTVEQGAVAARVLRRLAAKAGDPGSVDDVLSMAGIK